MSAVMESITALILYIPSAIYVQTGRIDSDAPPLIGASHHKLSQAFRMPIILVPTLCLLPNARLKYDGAAGIHD